MHDARAGNGALHGCDYLTITEAMLGQRERWLPQPAEMLVPRQSVPALSGIPWAPISLGTTWVPMEPSLGCCDTCSTLFFEARSQWSLIMKTKVGSRYQAYYTGCTALHASIDRVGPGSTTGISKSGRLNSTACPQRAYWSWTQHQQTCGNYDRDWIEEVQSGRPVRS